MKATFAIIALFFPMLTTVSQAKEASLAPDSSSQRAIHTMDRSTRRAVAILGNRIAVVGSTPRFGAGWTGPGH